MGAIDASEALLEARQAAERALALDNDLADAHTSLASLNEFDFDWVNAEKHYHQALTINPNYSKAHHWYAEMLARLGRFKESLTGLERAKNLDPVSPVMLSVLGMAYCANFREFSKADEQWNHALNLYSKLSLPFALKMNCFLWTSQHAQGVEWFEGNRSHIVSSPSLASSLGYAYAMTGLEGKARSIVNDLTSRVERGGVTSLHVAVVYIGLGDKNRAFLWLEKAYEARNWELGFLQVHPCYASLRTDPRYLSLVERMRLEHVGTRRKQ